MPGQVWPTGARYHFSTAVVMQQLPPASGLRQVLLFSHSSEGQKPKLICYRATLARRSLRADPSLGLSGAWRYSVGLAPLPHLQDSSSQQLPPPHPFRRG